jgi:Flp pilus assembly protein TadG
MARPRASRRDQGQATAELALLLPAILVALVLVLQVALVARDVVLVAHAAREAARAAAVQPTAAVARAAATRSGGLDPDRLHVSVQPSSTTVRVSVTYRIPTDLPLVGQLVGDRTTRATVTMRREDLEVPPARTDANPDNRAEPTRDSRRDQGPWEDLAP